MQRFNSSQAYFNMWRSVWRSAHRFLWVGVMAAVLVACGSSAGQRSVEPSPASPASPTADEATVSPAPTPTFLPLITTTAPQEEVEHDTYRVVNVYPHDPSAFTQGLVYVDGALYEGTGRRGQSSLRRVDLETGDVEQMVRLDDQYFGEGIAVYGDRIVQLTWQSNLGFVYDRQSFDQLSTFTYPTEGWGLTYDGERLIMSDGSHILRFLDPDTFEEIGRVDVFDRDDPVTQLNELEFIEGEVYANVWKSDYVVRIDPDTGRVTGRIDLSGLLPEADRVGVDVLNGIAYDEEQERLFFTGKLWPKLFEVELVPMEE